MNIAICGSMTHVQRMNELEQELIQRGHVVLMPDPDEAIEARKDPVAWAKRKREFIDAHFGKIDTADAILVVNEEKRDIAGYIGGNTLIEMAHAYAQGLEIFLLNAVPEVSYTDEILGLNPIVLNGDIANIDAYIETLPLVYMSTNSPVKLGGVSRAMRKAGLPVRVDGKKVESGVNEQPMTIEETYEGAFNRHKNLKDLNVEADYYVTVESGLHEVHGEFGAYGCTAIILEKAGEPLKLGIDFDIEFPKEMLAKVPSQYADIGVLAQAEFGAGVKDPYPHLTNGKVTRQALLENAFYNLVMRSQVTYGSN